MSNTLYKSAHRVIWTFPLRWKHYNAKKKSFPNQSSIFIRCAPRIFQTVAPVCNVGAEPRRLNGSVVLAALSAAAFPPPRRAAALAARGAGAKRPSFGSEVWELRSWHGTGMAWNWCWVILMILAILVVIGCLWGIPAHQSKEAALKAPQVWTNCEQTPWCVADWQSQHVALHCKWRFLRHMVCQPAVLPWKWDWIPYKLKMQWNAPKSLISRMPMILIFSLPPPCHLTATIQILAQHSTSLQGQVSKNCLGLAGTSPPIRRWIRTSVASKRLFKRCSSDLMKSSNFRCLETTRVDLMCWREVGFEVSEDQPSICRTSGIQVISMNPTNPTYSCD